MLVNSIYKSGLESTELIIENKTTVTIFDNKRKSKKTEQQYCQCHVASSAPKFHRNLFLPSEWINYIYQTTRHHNLKTSIFIVTVLLKTQTSGTISH
jgi:hypothetical protein